MKTQKLSAVFLLISMIGTSSVPAGALPLYTLRPLQSQNKAGAEELTNALRDKEQNPPVVADQSLLEQAQSGPLLDEARELAAARAALGTRAGQEEKPEDFTVQRIGRLKNGREAPAVPYTNGFLTGLAYAVADTKDAPLSDSAGGYLRSLPPGVQTVVQKTAQLIREERFSTMDMKVLQYSDGTPLAGLSGRDVAQFLYSVYVQGAEPRLKSRDYAAVVVSNEGSDLQVVAISEAGISDRFADSLGGYLIDRVGTGIFSIDGRLKYTVYQVGAYNSDYSLPKQYLSDAQGRTGPYLLVQLDIPARAAAGQEENVEEAAARLPDEPIKVVETLPSAALLTADAKTEVVRYLRGQIEEPELLFILDRLGIVEIQSGGAFMNQAELIRDAAAGQEKNTNLTVTDAVVRLGQILAADTDGNYRTVVFNTYRLPAEEIPRDRVEADVGNYTGFVRQVSQFSPLFDNGDGEGTVDIFPAGDQISVIPHFPSRIAAGLEERRRIEPGSGMRAFIGVVLGIAAVPLLVRFAEEKGNVPARLRGENPPVIRQLERIEPVEALNPPAAPVFTKVETVETFNEKFEPVALEPTRAAVIFTETKITYIGVPGMEIPGTGLRVDGFAYQDKGAAAIVPDALVSSGLVDAGRGTILIPASVVSPGTVVFAQAGVLSDEVVAKLRDQKVDIRTFTDLKNLPGDPEQGDVYLLDVPLGEERGVVSDLKDVVINFHPAGADKRIISSSDLGALILAAQNQSDLTLQVGGIRYSEQFSGLLAIDTGA